MKFQANTPSKPVVGKQARKLKRALKTGTSVTNELARATAQRIIDRRSQSLAVNAAK